MTTNRVQRSRYRPTCLLLCAAFGLAGLSFGCGGGSSSTGLNAPSVRSLAVARKPTPPLRVPYYRTSGAYPQVSLAGLDLDAVNRALRHAVLSEQQTYSRFARKRESVASKQSMRLYPGVYKTSINRQLISASTTVVSALMPTLQLLPGGNDGAFWISVTARVPSGTTVDLQDLLGSRNNLRALANIARRQILRSYACIRIVPALSGFASNWTNYRYFALAPSGLAIGFPNGQVASPGCGRASTIVRYALLRPYLSKLGKQLVEGVRPPAARRR